jgi:hypothetical protein
MSKNTRTKIAIKLIIFKESKRLQIKFILSTLKTNWSENVWPILITL